MSRRFRQVQIFYMLDGDQVALSSEVVFERKSNCLHENSACKDAAVLGHACWYSGFYFPKKYCQPPAVVHKYVKKDLKHLSRFKT